MGTVRDGPGAAALPDGKVLIVGGANSTATYPTTGELYDPATGKFETLASHMFRERYAPAVAVLPNGKVLITGGYADNPVEGSLASAELFNPATSTFERVEGAASEMTFPRSEATAAALQNGNVLVIGGFDSNLGGASSRYLASLESFSPASSTFEASTTALAEQRGGAAAVTLPSGAVLVAGGYNELVAGGQYPATAEERGVGASAAVTLPATGIGQSTATVSGTVTAEAVGSAQFQYGASTAYGAATASQSVAASLTPYAVRGPVRADADTTYHYRLAPPTRAAPSTAPT